MSLTLVERIAANAHAVLEPLDSARYHRLMEAGVIVEGAPIELLDGLLIRKDRRDSQGDIMTIGTRHRSTIVRLQSLLQPMFSPRTAHVQSQQPIELNAFNVPEPDLSVVIGSMNDYPVHHPRPNDVSLVIEVADSSLDIDLGRKQELYREAGIAEYWVVNLRDDVIEVFRGPQGGTWRETRRYSAGEIISTRWGEQRIEISVDAVLA
jgi:Uma2 family endonuclease